jgi:hypothetical protein
LAASHPIVFIVLLAPQVGLESTTLRLTAECFSSLPSLKEMSKSQRQIPTHLMWHIQ